MDRDTTIILQGPVSNETYQAISVYSELPFISGIILSTWSDARINNSLLHNTKVIYNRFPANPGIGNRNCQIVTSRNGSEVVNTKYAVKMRTDQIISFTSMKKMDEVFRMNQDIIHVCGMYRSFPYHPRDHVFWGGADKIYQLFDIPLDITEISGSMNPVDYTQYTRAETYIGSFYYSLFNKIVLFHIEEPLKYLVDGAPHQNLALNLDYEIRDKVFRPFPRIDMRWPKYGLSSYHYTVGAAHSEYWGD